MHTSIAIRPGEEVILVRDALLEIQVPRGRAPRTWCFVPRGTRARLVGREQGVGRIVLMDGPLARAVAFAAVGTLGAAGLQR